MIDLFAAAPSDLRSAKLSDYEQYLIERDGVMDVARRTLSKREATIGRYESTPAQTRDMDHDLFKRQYRAFDKNAAISKEMLLLLALVKVNAAEAYGVARNFQRTQARALKRNDTAELRILCEETYHTRILVSSANRYGLEVEDAYTPPSALRVLIGGIATAPMAIARPLTLAGEVIATLMFMKLIEVNREINKGDPETRDALEERLIEICIDERGHITYNRMHARASELAQTRLILPITARIMGTVFPEIVALGAFPTDVLSELPRLFDERRLPEEVSRKSFIA